MKIYVVMAGQLSDDSGATLHSVHSSEESAQNAVSKAESDKSVYAYIVEDTLYDGF